MKANPRERRPTAKQAIALLSDSGFRADVKDMRFTFVEGGEEEAVRAAEQELARKRAAFKTKWRGIVPPPDGALLDPDPRRREAAALLAGQWGIIRVFPWTSWATLEKEFKRIRRTLRRSPREAPNAHRAEVAQWLSDCGFSGPEIAAAVWNQTKGLKRSSNLRDADHLLKGYLKVGDDYLTAERKAKAAAADREAPAAAMVRAARSRHRATMRHQHQEFQAPLEVDPLSACLMKIIRLKFFSQGLPLVLPAGSIAEPLDPLLDELRRVVLEVAPSA